MTDVTNVEIFHISLVYVKYFYFFHEWSFYFSIGLRSTCIFHWLGPRGLQITSFHEYYYLDWKIQCLKESDWFSTEQLMEMWNRWSRLTVLLLNINVRSPHSELVGEPIWSLVSFCPRDTQKNNNPSHYLQSFSTTIVFLTLFKKMFCQKEQCLI